MRRYVLAVLGALVLITLIIMTQIPSSTVSAQGEPEFTIDSGTLVSYNGIETTVVIPSNVSAIGPEAFRDTKLTSITIPSTVRNIERGAFYSCDNLQRVTLEEGVKSIGVSAFSMCKKLDSVVIPASVINIGAGAFSGCSALEAISVSPGNRSFFCNDGVLYNSDSTTLIQYLAGRRATSFTMPFSVDTIDSYAFWGTSLLTHVDLSNNVKAVDSYTFTDCEGLTDVFLPESVQRIDAYAFSDCPKLSLVEMEGSAVDIDELAFDGCDEKLVQKTGVTNSSTSGSGVLTSSGMVYGDEAEDVISGNETASNRSAKLESPVSTITTNRKQVDTTTPKGLIGASRIVGGSALVIPLEKTQTKKDAVSQDTVSQNE